MVDAALAGDAAETIRYHDALRPLAEAGFAELTSEKSLECVPARPLAVNTIGQDIGIT